MKSVMKALVVLFVLFGISNPLCGQVAVPQPDSTSALSSPLVTAQTAKDHLRFTALTVGSRIRLEILSPAGDTLFDSNLRPGNLIEWPLGDQQGSRLSDGVYGCIVTVAELSGRVTYGRGLFRLADGKATFDASVRSLFEAASVGSGEESTSILATDDRFPFTFMGHDGTDARIESATGGLILHAGRFYAGEAAQSPHMRLTPDGNLGIGVRDPRARLDVEGLIHTSQGIMFPDGTIQKTAANPIVLGATVATDRGNPGLGSNASSLLRSLSAARDAGSGRVLAQGGDPGRVNGAETLWNTYYGSGAGASLNEAGGGSYNALFGYHAGGATTTGVSNSMVGDNAGAYNITGSGNTYLGSVAGYFATASSNNTFVGFGAGKNNTYSGNAFVGFNAGFANTSGSANAFFGTQAGAANTTGCCNGFAGFQAGIANTTGSSNSFFGDQAGDSNTIGSFNTLMGAGTGGNIVSANNNTMVGFQSGMGTTSSDNAFFGYHSGLSNTTGSENTFMGSDAALNNTTGFQNVILGRSSGRTNTTGAYNAFLGFETGYSNLEGWANAFWGHWAGHANTSGHWNAFGGTRAGYQNTTGSLNAFFGQEAGQGNTTGSSNSSFGAWAIGNSTTGNNNTAAGYYSGLSMTTESNNSFLGAYTSGSAGITNATAIGYQAKVTQSNSLVLGSINGVNGSTADTKVGIGTTTPDRKLQIASTPGMNAELHIGGSGDEAKDVFSGMGVDLSAGPAFNFGYSGFSFGRSSGFFNVRPDASAVAPNPSLRFMTANQQRMIITNTGNVGIGTTVPPKTRLQADGGDIFIGSPGQGIILMSPDGLMCAKLTLSNAGAMVSTPQACP